MSSAAPPFDPYYEWLAIGPHEQPADFYRLLGIARFETDLARIAAAADQRMALVRSFQTGPRGIYTQRLLNELSAARLGLLSPESKAAYDAALSRHLAARVVPNSMPNHPAYGGGGPAPGVLTFGLGQTAIPPAPPVLPPPPPAAPRVALDLGAPAEALPAAPARPTVWWSPLVRIVGVTLLVLACVVGYGVGKPYLERALAATSTAESVPTDSEGQPAVKPAPEPPAPKPLVLVQEGSGGVTFSPATATLGGAVQLQVEGTEEVLTNWTTTADAAEWRFKLVKPGFFQAEVVYATAADPAGARLELTIGQRTNAIGLRDSGGREQFVADGDKTILVSSTAEQTLVVRLAGAPQGDWLVLRSVRLMPAEGRSAPSEQVAPP